nr:hypothetical protein csv005 [uncultured bacterium]
MQEIELKFQIPTEALATLSADIERLPGHDRERLQAHYFDTPDRLLGQARSALRLRKEGERWVQTLKASGANTMIRLEDNQAASAPADGQAARVDLGLHRGTPAEAALVRHLAWDPGQDPRGDGTGLVELYRTDIWRHSARLAVGQGTPHAGVVELALDIGHIHAGHLSVPVRELEIELVQGHPAAVLESARDWVTAHALWLDTQTKAHRGDRLARQAEGKVPGHAPPQAGTPPLDLATALDAFTAAMSEVASSPDARVDQVDDWLLAAHRLALLNQTRPGSLPERLQPGIEALVHEIETAASPARLARATPSTLLCLDLFATLL